MMKYINEVGTGAIVPILIMGFASLLLIVFAVVRVIMKKSNPLLMIDSILLLGFLSFSYPICRLMIGLFGVATAVANAGEVSSTLAWGGIHHSLISIIPGFVILNISAIGWFVLRRFRTNKVG
jgi:hypothetical protein